ncbi:MAG: recombination protein O N-terminal domain-containing protein [Patescibacteria group bacterium]|nr:recombination protein O N-terminal domain-containing protein [Patescibacteria group bacterium]MDE2218107.1 recombination protein O N-terminal domain-containing protein [Patescibacteria group bacterium]
MSHHTYHTEGFVLNGQSVGEANKYFRIFTKDFGMIGATAQGVRLLQSKLRYSLQDYSYSKISLVRGKQVWRITGAIKEKDISNLLNDSRDKFELLAKTFSLLLRLVRGEEKNEALFNHIHSVSEFLKKEILDENLLRNCEFLLIMRILHSLGYMAETPNFKEFIASSLWTRELVLKMNPLGRDAACQINKALKETQL